MLSKYRIDRNGHFDQRKVVAFSIYFSTSMVGEYLVSPLVQSQAELFQFHLTKDTVHCFDLANGYVERNFPGYVNIGLVDDMQSVDDIQFVEE